MAQKTTTSKQDEIKLIKKLHDMNGYFAAAFCHDDLAVMENNINADYDLLCGTTRDDSVELAALKKRIKDLEEELKATYAGFNEQYRKACDLTAERNKAKPTRKPSSACRSRSATPTAKRKPPSKTASPPKRTTTPCRTTSTRRPTSASASGTRSSPETSSWARSSPPPRRNSSCRPSTHTKTNPGPWRAAAPAERRDHRPPFQ